MIHWDWTDPPKRQRKLITVSDNIFWAYSMLSISRQIVKDRKQGKADRFEGGRYKWANIETSRYQEQKRNISTLDRDDALAQDGIKVCAHCGASESVFHWDHLIPKSRLVGEYIALNQVRSCAACNLSRGNFDLMQWHRQHSTFPTLGVLRRYLKLCYSYAKSYNYLATPADEAVANGLPFDLMAPAAPISAR